MRNLLSIFLLLLCSLAGAQEHPMLHYTVEDGLPSDMVYRVYRDSKGFLWFATDKGIARYNGITFTKFTTDDGLPDNEIFAFTEDHQGRLWLATFNGELCFFKDGKFHTAHNTSFLPPTTSANPVERLNVEYDSSVTIIRKWDVLNIKGEKVIHNFSLASSTLSTADLFSRLAQEKTGPGKYRLITNGNVFDVFCAADRCNVQRVSSNQFDKYLVNELNWFWSVMQDQTYLVNEKYVFDGALNIRKQLPDGFIISHYIYGVFRSRGQWIILTDKGAFIDDDGPVLTNKKVSGVTEDQCGNYWFTTLGDGVFVIPKYFSRYKIIHNAYDRKPEYSREVGGRLLFVTENADVSMLHDGTVSTVLPGNAYTPRSSWGHYLTAYFIGNNFSYYWFSDYFSVHIPNLLAKPQQVVKKRFDHRYRLKKIFFADTNMYFSSNETMLKFIGTFDRGMARDYKILNDTNFSKHIYHAAQAPDKGIWYSDGKGLAAIRGDSTVKLKDIANKMFKAFEFCGSYLVGYTHNNQLIVCNNYYGDAVYDTIFSKNCIWDKLYPLDSFHLLASTNELYRLITVGKPAGGRSTATVIDNPFVPLRADAICVGDSSCYFFKKGSITTIAKHELLSASGLPVVSFSEIASSKRRYSIDPIVSIPFAESKNITIKFSTLSFSSKLVSYQYSLSKGNGDNWIDIKDEQINIVNSRYGEYVVKVRAKTPGSSYSTPISLQLTIGRPFWATWWFITLMVGVATAI
ncbi:MAG: two-component regulator propeller domain-containing protein, partial [Bacteroidota bacterium]